jgi:hypothetical protein
MKYKVENSKMPLQQNEQRHIQRLAKYMPSSSNNSDIQYSHVQKCSAGVLLSSTRGKSLGTRLSFVSHQRITIQ